MPGIIKSYRDLVVWQKSVDLAVDLYGVTRRFPSDERYDSIKRLSIRPISSAPDRCTWSDKPPNT
jgi:hypothetical protein